jgi:hypothetical protein
MVQGTGIGMPYRTRATPCVVGLIPLRRLCPATLAQSAALRREAGRCWTDLVAAHQPTRATGHGLSRRELEQRGAAGGAGEPYALHRQTIQALAQQLDANRATATDRRKQEAAPAAEGSVTTADPEHSKPYHTVDQALQVPAGQMRRSTGARRAPLLLPLPEACHHADMRKAQLTWRADHYELCLTIDTAEPLPPSQAGGEVAGGTWAKCLSPPSPRPGAMRWSSRGGGCGRVSRVALGRTASCRRS